MSGKAAEFALGRTIPHSDVLWTNPLIGDSSSQGLPDTAHTLVPSLHNFTYDIYFYGSDLENSQVLEFDINQYFGGMSFIWGQQCRIAGGHEWDIFNAKWIPTGVACYPASNSWNHVTIAAQRTSDNWLFFQSITLWVREPGCVVTRPRLLALCIPGGEGHAFPRFRQRH